mmetsp:Transcript_83942/g.237829  ORF Transcript_83942/g.237829 Transcript_83942/m.237829 type:complete len:227 (-) Transcript_83942:37-717(-)
MVGADGGCGSSCSSPVLGSPSSSNGGGAWKIVSAAASPYTSSGAGARSGATGLLAALSGSGGGRGTQTSDAKAGVATKSPTIVRGDHASAHFWRRVCMSMRFDSCGCTGLSSERSESTSQDLERGALSRSLSSAAGLPGALGVTKAAGAARPGHRGLDEGDDRHLGGGGGHSSRKSLKSNAGQFRGVVSPQPARGRACTGCSRRLVTCDALPRVPGAPTGTRLDAR